MIPVFFYLLIIPGLVLIFYAYHFKNPILLVFSAMMALLVMSLAFSGRLSIEHENEVCTFTSTNSTTVGNVSSTETTSYCTVPTVTYSFNDRMLGILFLLLSLYLLYQAALGLFFVKAE